MSDITKADVAKWIRAAALGSFCDAGFWSERLVADAVLAMLDAKGVKLCVDVEIADRIMSLQIIEDTP